MLRVPLTTYFGGQTNLFVAELRQTKDALFTNKADLSSLPDNKNLLLAAQKQLLELALDNCRVDAIELNDNGKAFINEDECIRCSVCHGVCPTDAVRHDGERIPADVERNVERVTELLKHYETIQDQRSFLERMERYFNKQSKVASLSGVEIAAKRAKLN